ncbi:VRR-NUC domain-containing protein [Ruficoccus amylovorans]|uniref:VRR-NUC domain-containing protein n=1 Tax=Ruficoccus amylovorans TaxID=1804625 RepID=A0A842HDZ3_9BACT|nr:VRR-NUC domain-containing protein [Ruficoccus amylovorans]
MNRRNEEHRLQVALFKWAKYASARHPGLKLMFAIPNGGARDAITGAMLKAEGVKAGVPDIFLPLSAGGFHGLFIELKTARGHPTPEQREWLMRLRHRGYATVLCRGLDEALDTITRYLGGQLSPENTGYDRNFNNQ